MCQRCSTARAARWPRSGTTTLASTQCVEKLLIALLPATPDSLGEVELLQPAGGALCREILPELPHALHRPIPAGPQLSPPADALVVGERNDDGERLAGTLDDHAVATH